MDKKTVRVSGLISWRSARSGYRLATDEGAIEFDDNNFRVWVGESMVGGGAMREGKLAPMADGRYQLSVGSNRFILEPHDLHALDRAFDQLRFARFAQALGWDTDELPEEPLDPHQVLEAFERSCLQHSGRTTAPESALAHPRDLIRFVIVKSLETASDEAERMKLCSQLVQLEAFIPEPSSGYVLPSQERMLLYLGGFSYSPYAVHGQLAKRPPVIGEFNLMDLHGPLLAYREGQYLAVVAFMSWVATSVVTIAILDTPGWVAAALFAGLFPIVGTGWAWAYLRLGIKSLPTNVRKPLVATTWLIQLTVPLLVPLLVAYGFRRLPT